MLDVFRADQGPLLAVARTWRALRDEGVTPERMAAWRSALSVLREGKPRRPPWARRGPGPSNP
jgi:hypothetical protein